MALSFMAVHGCGNFAPECLSPRLMRWSDEIWLLDLRPTRSYWEKRGPHFFEDMRHTLTRQLAQHYTQEATQQLITTEAHQTAPLCAAFSSHPWRCLLLLQMMMERSLHSFIASDSPLGQTMLTNLGWPQWLSLVQQYYTKEKIGPSLARLQRFVERSAIARPTQLRHIPADDIRRRFGKAMAEAWTWTFPDKNLPKNPKLPSAANTQARDLFTSYTQALNQDPRAEPNLLLPESCDHFHWQSWTPLSRPSVTRYLDETLRYKEEILPLLCEDLDRLCRHRDWHPERHALALDWELTDIHMKKTRTSLRFRHPHCLAQEYGQHKTTLTQIDFLLAQTDLLAMPEDALEYGISAWQLEISESIFVPTQERSLLDQEEHFSRSLRQLDNQLPTGLQGLSLRNDFLPEDRVQTSLPEGNQLPAPAPTPAATPAPTLAPWPQSLGGETDKTQTSKTQPNKTRTPRRTGARSPLFLLTQAEACVPQGQLLFLEKTSDKWWDRLSFAANSRDYYLLIDAQAKRFWLFRDHAGCWFKHGIYS
jgi:hypothetical protein